MALFVALIAALILAVVVVLGVMAWVLLAPLLRQRRGRRDDRERDRDELDATVLFGRPAGRVDRNRTRLPEPLRDTVIIGRSQPKPPPAPRVEAEPVVVPAASIPDAPPAAEPPPAADAPTPPEPPPPPAAPAAAPPVADVLVVTADSALSACQLAILSARGCASRQASTAADAVGHLRDRIPDLMLLDAGGASEAVRFVAALRAWQATELLPVVLFTPRADADVSRCAAEFGVTDVVVNAQNVPGLVERALPYWLAGVGVFSSTFD